MHLIHVYGKKYERGSNWSEPEVLELLQIWSDVPVQTELVTCLRNQHVFNRIASTLRQKGINRTGDQCREKIKKLKLEYKQKTLRSARYYELMEKAQSNRTAAASGATLPLWGDTTTNEVVGLQGDAPGAEVPGHPSIASEILEIKTEVMSSDDEATGPPEMLYEFGPVDDDDEASADHKNAVPNTEELAFTDGEQGNNTHVTCSPSDFSDQNMTVSSGAGVSPATAPMAIRERGNNGNQEGHRGSGSFLQRKRRRVGRGGDGVLTSALASYLSWQQPAEERFLALEEARMRQEARAEERREKQEEKRAQQEREHEFRLMSMLTRVLNSARRAETSATPLLLPNSLQTLLPYPSSTSAKAPAVPINPWGDQTRQYNPYLSLRGNNMRLQQGILKEGYTQYHANKHDENTNPDGIINMGTSENKLCFDLLQKRLMRPDMLHVEPAFLQYPDWKGHSFLREEVAKFLSDYCHSPSPLKAEHVVVMNGCGSVFSALATVLCNPEDAILIPSPFYGAITEDVGVYSSVKLHHVPLDSQPTGSDVRPFQLTVEKLENSLKEAKKEGLNVKALILLNPHNPLGELYSAEEMTSFIKFAKKHELHVIVDEIYMLSVFSETDKFCSVLSLDRLPDPQRTHILWGASKDFAMGGMRVGMVYSQNRDVVQALDQLGSFHGVPGLTQYQMAQLLRDRVWLNSEFLPENRRRLREAHSYLTGELKEVGIPFLHRGAGFFVWADLSKYLKEKTFAEELSVWSCFIKHKVLLSCGQAFNCTSPGWFRIIFSDQQHKLKLGVQRIRKALEDLQSSAMLESLETTGDTQGNTSESVRREDIKNTKDEGTNKTVKTSSVQTKHQNDTVCIKAEPVSLADEDFVSLNGQSTVNSESLGYLIGTLQQQIHSSDWLEKNTPELAPGEDPKQLDVFTDLLNRARK
ncbi:1-aminocyclopropane-1-carboxylate synthase-like protein 1 [Myxocyprinus asiaticus]|uniref:1-aminocyclopropane-1-carboxylate synthase-like protein 1 n=1 Tax=Myxocyprinus asiaticus TaxID=70543 RepID=UPI00222185CF|nr:1-aminocyclopropane-1-carboxylate synthase-like protein 1 [Myxocyprinus asiaticus]XP_051548096.1 1-aminocyclopropane-1-carboxylate synthase-like protein 1 [Myxocyprinus asiaticus]